MLERLLLVAALTALITLGVLATRAWVAHRSRRLHGSPLLTALGTEPDGRRTLVTFSTPSCAACHTAQAPAVIWVQERLGMQQLRVIKIDATTQPEVAKAFGVLTVPSTAVLDALGRLSAINHGFAPSQRLVEQLEQTA
jgi:thiol-disulfide isomerase/thioredoxin